MFDHNIDQIEQASKLAIDYKFGSFSLNRSVKEKFFRAEGKNQVHVLGNVSIVRNIYVIQNRNT